MDPYDSDYCDDGDYCDEDAYYDFDHHDDCDRRADVALTSRNGSSCKVINQLMFYLMFIIIFVKILSFNGNKKRK